MPNDQDKETSSIVGKSLITATALTLDLIEELIQRLRGKSTENDTIPPSIFDDAQALITDIEPLVAEHFAITQWTAWTAGANWLSRLFPSWLIREFETGFRQEFRGSPPKPPSRFGRFGFDDSDDSVIRFPKIEKAAESLTRRGILTPEEFEIASDSIRQQSFTVARQSSEDAIRTVRDTLAENIREGTSLEGFEKKLRKRMEGSQLGPGHLETVYRTNVQAAFRDGRETLASNPIVNDAFPYQEYIPIGDDRVRPHHCELGKLGLNGTGVYRRDDPTWDLFTPPWSYNCRCGINLLTLDKAARKGVKEAQRWLETGRPPERPEYRIDAITFRPDRGWGARRGVLAV